MVELYDRLNQAWKQTCKIVLGDEVGELKDYEDLLRKPIEGVMVEKPSSISGESVSAPFEYKNLPVASLNELDKLTRIKLGIDEIKDIDTIVERLKEEFVYVGNMALGKSLSVEKSTKVIDSQYVYESYDVFNSRFAAYTAHIRNQHYAFGARIGGNANFVILSTGYGGNEKNASYRLFENVEVAFANDVYYSVNCISCQEAIFTFFKYGARYTIGNLQLSPDKYKRIKAALLEGVRDNLKAKKHVSIFDLFMEGTEEREEAKRIVQEKLRGQAYEVPFDKKPIQEAFTATSKLLLGKPLEGDIDEYSTWLDKETPYYDYTPVKSAFMGYPSHITYKLYKLPKDLVEKTFLTKKEGDILKDISITPEEAEKLSFSDLDYLKHKISRIYTITLHFIDDQSFNYDDIVVIAGSRDVYKAPLAIFSKKVAYSLFPRQSAYQFGSSLVLQSEFGINVYMSDDIKRGFEVDNSAHSSDIYFSHNCEGSSDVMFCFNGKGQRNSIGHNQLPREKYLEVKAALLEQIWSELNAKKDFRYGIYSLVRE